MRTWIPYEEILERHMKIPGYAERLEIAQRELEEEIAIYGTIANPKYPQPTYTSRRLALFAKKPRVHSRRRQVVARPAVEA